MPQGSTFITGNLYVVSRAAPGGHPAAPHVAPYRAAVPQHLTPLASWQVLPSPWRLPVLQGKTPFGARIFSDVIFSLISKLPHTPLYMKRTTEFHGASSSC